MCVSLRPAHFSQTKGLAAEAEKDGKVVHLLGYQNTVVNRVNPGRRPMHAPPPGSRRGGDFGWGKKPGKGGDDAKPQGTGNAMLLPIPAVPGTMTERNVVDTSSAPHFLSDMERAIRPVTRGGLRRGGGKTLGRGADKVVVFDHDIYTIVLANNVRAIPKALALVPEDKRPPVNDEMFKAYAKWYKDWTFAFCCFNTHEEANAKPLLWWYEPMHPEFLFFPALDGHDGKVPNLEAEVDVDHAIIVSTRHMQREETGSEVSFSDNGIASSLYRLLPQYVIGRQFNESMQNGDFLFQVADVDNGLFDYKRELPPGAQEELAPKPPIRGPRPPQRPNTPGRFGKLGGRRNGK